MGHLLRAYFICKWGKIMNIDRTRGVCISGYGLRKLSLWLNNKALAEYIKLRNDIQAEINKAVEQGYDTFLCSMARGFELICAHAVLEARQKQSNIQLICVLPFKNYSYSDEWGELFRTAKRDANHEIIISEEEYNPTKYNLRNLYMIENSSYVICSWDGQNDVTAQIIHLAKKHGHIIHNLHREGCLV